MPINITYVADASTTNRGLVNITTQSFAGAKTFTGGLTISAGGFSVTGLSGVVKAVSGTISASSIVDADVSTSAAIQFSKLAALSSANIIVGNGSSVAAAVAVSGEITLSNAGATAIVRTITPTWTGSHTFSATGTSLTATTAAIFNSNVYINNNGTGTGAGSTGTLQIGDATIAKTFGSAFIFGAGVTIPQAVLIQGGNQITLNNSANTFASGFKDGGSTATIIYAMPVTAPTSGQVLASTAPTSGVATLSWTSNFTGPVFSANTTTVPSCTITASATVEVTTPTTGQLWYDGTFLYFKDNVSGYTKRLNKRRAIMVLCSGFTPTSGADVAEYTVPYHSDGFTSVTWNVRRINVRVQTAGGAPVVSVEYYSGTGAFTATATVGTVTLGSGASEGAQTSSFTTSTLTSGYKVRFNVGTLATATNWTIILDLEEN
jgi:fibronectin-binding autotransporter adhesin